MYVTRSIEITKNMKFEKRQSVIKYERFAFIKGKRKPQWIRVIL
jgi:hypothetical protein